jgi:hypothetical protein
MDIYIIQKNTKEHFIFVNNDEKMKYFSLS